MMYERAPNEDPNKAANMPIYVLEVVIFTVPPVVQKQKRNLRNCTGWQSRFIIKKKLQILSAKLIALRTLILSITHKLHHQFQGSFEVLQVALLRVWMSKKDTNGLKIQLVQIEDWCRPWNINSGCETKRTPRKLKRVPENIPSEPKQWYYHNKKLDTEPLQADFIAKSSRNSAYRCCSIQGTCLQLHGHPTSHARAQLPELL